MKIIISPFAKKLRNGNQFHPKDYPYWKELIELISKNIPHVEIIQIGTEDEEALVDDMRKNLSFKQLKELIEQCDTFITIDSFFQHMCAYYKKKGVVLFGRSNPEIFGYSQNINLLKDQKMLRHDQFGLWESCEYKKEAFVSAEMAFDSVISLIS